MSAHFWFEWMLMMTNGVYSAAWILIVYGTRAEHNENSRVKFMNNHRVIITFVLSIHF